MPRIHVSRRVPERVRRELETEFDLTIHDSELPPARADLLGGAENADGLVTMLIARSAYLVNTARGPIVDERGFARSRGAASGAPRSTSTNASPR